MVLVGGVGGCWWNLVIIVGCGWWWLGGGWWWVGGGWVVRGGKS